MTRYWLAYRLRSGQVLTRDFGSATARVLFALSIEAYGMESVREWEEVGDDERPVHA